MRSIRAEWRHVGQGCAHRERSGGVDQDAGYHNVLHKTFSACGRNFCSTTMPFWMALRAGKRMPRLDALRRIADIFIIGNDRLQILPKDYLAEVARCPRGV